MIDEEYPHPVLRLGIGRRMGKGHWRTEAVDPADVNPLLTDYLTVRYDGAITEAAGVSEPKQDPQASPG